MRVYTDTIDTVYILSICIACVGLCLCTRFPDIPGCRKNNSNAHNARTRRGLDLHMRNSATYITPQRHSLPYTTYSSTDIQATCVRATSILPHLHLESKREARVLLLYQVRGFSQESEQNERLRRTEQGEKWQAQAAISNYQLCSRVRMTLETNLQGE